MAEPEVTTNFSDPFNVSCFCGYRGLVCDHIYTAATGETRQGVEHEIRAAVQAEKERCAKVADRYSVNEGSAAEGAGEPEFGQLLYAEQVVRYVAAAIRAEPGDA